MSMYLFILTIYKSLMSYEYDDRYTLSSLVRYQIHAHLLDVSYHIHLLDVSYHTDVTRGSTCEINR